MNLIDRIDPKGFVVIKDKDGKVLAANYNTIVNEGRKTMIAKLLSNVFSGNEPTTFISGINKEDAEYDFCALCLGSKTGETTVNYTYNVEGCNEYSSEIHDDKLDEDKPNPFWFPLPDNFKDYDSTENQVSEYRVNYDPDANRYYISITVRVVPGSHQLTTDQVAAVSSLAILMKNENTGNYRIFSRFRFDAIPLTSESEFILTYYIYF